MFKVGNSSQRRHQLPEQSRAPEVSDLENLFVEASKQPGLVVELAWSTNRQPYVLTCKLERRNNEHSHQWSFYHGDGEESKLEWNYESSDFVQIYSLVMTAFPGISDPSLQSLQPNGNAAQSNPQFQGQSGSPRLTPVGQPQGGPKPFGQHSGPQPIVQQPNGQQSGPQQIVSQPLGQQSGAQQVVAQPFGQQSSAQQNVAQPFDQQSGAQQIVAQPQGKPTPPPEYGKFTGAQQYGHPTQQSFNSGSQQVVPQTNSQNSGSQQVVQQQNDQISGSQQIVPQQNAQNTGSQPGVRQSGPQAVHRKKMGVMEGSLADMPLHSLLNSIQNSRLTGRLSINSHDEMSEMFFEDGHVVAVHRPNQDGDEAFLELAMNSSTGDFKFFDSDTTPNKTIKMRLDALMLMAAALSDHTKFLDRQGLKPDSCLMRANATISEQEFEGKLNSLVPVDMSLQKRMYQMIDNKVLFSDMIAKCGLTRSVWTPVIFNLVSSGIVRIENKTEDQPPKNAALEHTGSNLTIDLIALEKFSASMARRDTGIYTEIAFLFFLEHEFYRFHSYDTAFSIALFKLAHAPGMPENGSLRHALSLVKGTVRKADILGHYEGDDYAVILPHTDPNAALGLFNRLQSLLQQPPFAPNEIILQIGIAGIPQDCQDLTSLLKIARFRKKTSAKLD
ncbi:MAG: DUF4388 domain-containing protein [Candidatus Melainabacteria bacterium]|nr:DUF4388 domain-containing protein [Candidatus Melainabacteria bacterium]